MSNTFDNPHDTKKIHQQSTGEDESVGDGAHFCMSSYEDIVSGSIHPCPVSSENVLASVAEQSPVGKSLQEALERLIRQDSKTSSSISRNNSPALTFRRTAANQIMVTFGRSVARTWTDPKTRTGRRYQGARNPPDGLIRAKVHYYNRLGSKWRIVLKNVELLPRVPLDPSRKKPSEQSLLDQSRSSSSECPIQITDSSNGNYKGLLQVLAFDDI
jgi:hypothetical protein